MSWATVTTSSIYSVLTDAEYTQHTTLSTGSVYTQTNIIQDTINDVISMIRGDIAAGVDYLDNVDTNIPQSLHYTAKSIIAYRLLQRTGGKITDIDHARKDEYDQAMLRLEEVRKGKVYIEYPGDDAWNDNVVLATADGNSSTKLIFP